MEVILLDLGCQSMPKARSVGLCSDHREDPQPSEGGMFRKTSSRKSMPCQ
ncbi:MAG: hypothetical protein MZV70_13790 [Desulfobacterales bacterium]|nr:hypothetical protein [Desulfobacterales bacterium]